MLELPDGHIDFEQGEWAPSKNCEQGDQLIERERIATYFDGFEWVAAYDLHIEDEIGIDGDHKQRASKRLVAAMRSFVTSRVGETIDL